MGWGPQNGKEGGLSPSREPLGCKVGGKWAAKGSSHAAPAWGYSKALGCDTAASFPVFLEGLLSGMLPS